MLIKFESFQKLIKLKNKYKKIYFFPFNVQSRYLHLKLKKSNSYFVDNYASINKKLIRPSKIEDKLSNLLVITDKNLEKYLIKDFFYLKKTYQNLTEKKEKIINLDNKKNKNLSISRLFLEYNTDKGKYYKRLIFRDKSHNYGPFYNKELKHLRNKKLKILEIGAFKGSSTAAFHNYFKNSSIYAVDREKKIFNYKSNRIKFFKLDYMNQKQVKKFTNKFLNYFDIIIDDGGHFKSHILHNIKNFFKCLRNNSFYIIEDYGLKFDYLNDKIYEPNIFSILKKLSEKKNFKSQIISKKYQNFIISKIDRINSYTGDWVRSEKNISDICFIKTKK